MKRKIRLNATFTIGSQPNEEELKNLAQQGFRSVLNFREDHEDDQPLSPSTEGIIVRELGMEYANIPVSYQNLQVEQIEVLRNLLEDLPTPIFAHCYRGKRAAIFVVLQQAIQEGLSEEETLQLAKQTGFECDTPELKKFVKSCLEQSNP